MPDPAAIWATLHRRLAALVHSCARLAPRHDDQEGQGLVEYGLILVLIAVVVILIIGLVGHQVSNLFSNVSSGLGH